MTKKSLKVNTKDYVNKFVILASNEKCVFVEELDDDGFLIGSDGDGGLHRFSPSNIIAIASKSS
jgi:hypothetical protein